jgi:hypothetical protein
MDTLEIPIFSTMGTSSHSERLKDGIIQDRAQ